MPGPYQGGYVPGQGKWAEHSKMWKIVKLCCEIFRFLSFWNVQAFGGRGILPGVAIGSGLGTQNGALMSLEPWKKMPEIKLYVFLFTGAGVLGQGGIGPGGTSSECPEAQSLLKIFMAEIQYCTWLSPSQMFNFRWSRAAIAWSYPWLPSHFTKIRYIMQQKT